MPALSCGVVLLAVCGVGLYGSHRLARDLKADEDHKETLAQRLLEVFFWVSSVCTLALFVLSIFFLTSDAASAVEETASLYPSSFYVLAERLLIDPTPNTGSLAKAEGAVTALRITGCAVASGLLLLLPCTLVTVRRIITEYEVIQGMMRNLSGLAIFMCMGTVYVSSVGLMMSGKLGFDANLQVVLCIQLATGIAVVPVMARGLLAAHKEDIDEFDRFRRMAIPLALTSLAVSTATLVLAATSVGPYVSNNCRTLTQTLPESFLANMPLGYGCTKYYGEAIVLPRTSLSDPVSGLSDVVNGTRVKVGDGQSNESVITGAYTAQSVADTLAMAANPSLISPAVGELTSCISAKDRAYAWEYATTTCQPIYGCLNLGAKAAPPSDMAASASYDLSAGAVDDTGGSSTSLSTNRTGNLSITGTGTSTGTGTGDTSTSGASSRRALSSAASHWTALARQVHRRLSEAVGEAMSTAGESSAYEGDALGGCCGELRKLMYFSLLTLALLGFFISVMLGTHHHSNSRPIAAALCSCCFL